MKTSKVEIKKDINVYDIANVVDMAVDFVIGKHESGNVYYRPYFMDEGIKYAVIVFLLDGIEIEADDNLFDCYEDIKEVRNVVDDFMVSSAMMNEIVSYIKDVVSYKKSLYTSLSDALKDELIALIEKEQKLNDALIEAANVQKKINEQLVAENDRNAEIMSHLTNEELIEIQKRLASGDLNMSTLADDVVAKYVDSELHRNNQDEVKKSKVVNITEVDPSVDDGK